jgi:aminoglycoside phosphotransferase (APT) family kinase protein
VPPAWALARVPGVGAGAAPPSIERLDGGSVNEVFRIDTTAGSFVLRLNGAAWRRPGVDRERELALHRAAAAAGIAPPIVAVDPAADGLLITEFQGGRLWRESDYRDVASLRRLGERLQALHALAVPAVASFDPWAIAQGYLRQVRVAPPHAPLSRLERCCAALAAEGGTPCIVHGDLAHNNLLEGSRLWLLDWEYAQRADPLMDVACVLAYYPAAEHWSTELCAAAGLAAPPGEPLAARVYIYRALSWLWSLARGEPVAPP